MAIPPVLILLRGQAGSCPLVLVELGLDALGKTGLVLRIVSGRGARVRFGGRAAVRTTVRGVDALFLQDTCRHKCQHELHGSSSSKFNQVRREKEKESVS